VSLIVKDHYSHEMGRGVSSERGDRDGDHGVAIYVTVVLLWSFILFSSIYFIRP
jgi:hypothetical protein